METADSLTDYYRQRFLKKIEEIARISTWTDQEVNYLLKEINRILDNMNVVCISMMLEKDDLEEVHAVWKTEAETLRRWLSFIFESQIILEEEY